MQKYGTIALKIVSRSQISIVKNGMKKILNMKFSKSLSKTNYMINTVTKSLNSSVKSNENYKVEIKRELILLSELENQNSLEDSILRNKMIC